MALRLEELAKTLDHALLDPSATAADLDRLCSASREHHVASVCVLPGWVTRAADALRGSDVKVATLVGLTSAGQSRRAAVAAAERALADGAEELEVVLDGSALRAGDIASAGGALGAVVRRVRLAHVNGGRGPALVKAVVDCGLVGHDGLRRACCVAAEAGADFVHASAAGGSAVPALQDVELVRDSLPGEVGVKVGGPIATVEDAEAAIDAGASRLGTPHALAVVRDHPNARRRA